jgi:high affinity Mn2+ porin
MTNRLTADIHSRSKEHSMKKRYPQFPVLLFALAASPAFADEAKPDETFSLHVQSTYVTQQHAAFNAPYSGTNSLIPAHETKSSFTATMFAGARLWPGAEIYVNPEAAAGKGLSGVLGVAGFPNGEVARVSGPELKVYRARLFLRQTFGLGGERKYIDADQNQLAGWQDPSRIVVTLGNFSALDVFDDNAYSHEPRAQFMNWSLLTNGAWDYPADSRGYTNGLAIEYIRPGWALRLGTFMLPREANGLPLDAAYSRAHGEAIELEKSYALFGQPGKLRLLAYDNRAHMGAYRQALAASPQSPDITATRAYRGKYGWGVNVEQQAGEDIGLFARVGWNDGRTETWSFTEIDSMASVGLSVKGARWQRAADVLGIAMVSGGLSRDHRDYLAAGGVGFIIGDGALAYAREQIVETYYSVALFKGVALSLDWQHIRNPAYNADRGPVNVFSSRAHIEF